MRPYGSRANEFEMKMKNKGLFFRKLLLCIAGSTFLTVSGQDVADTLVSMEPKYRRVLLEEFTGMHCPNCPAGHKVANEIRSYYPEDCFLVNIHAGNLAVPSPGEVNLRSAYGDALATQAGVTGIPSASIGRHLFPGQSSMAIVDRDSWLENVEELLGMETYVNIGAEASIDWQSRELEVRVQLYYTGDSPEAENHIHVVLLQNNVEGTQDGSEANPDQVLANGNYLHQHVLRDLLTGIEGDAVGTTVAGSLVQRTYSMVLPETLNQLDLDIMQLQVLAFVTESEYEVMDVCEAPVAFANGPEYVFEMSDFAQLAQNSCDNLVRLAFALKNRNPEDKIVESVTFQFMTPKGLETEYICGVDAWEDGIFRVETDAVSIDKTGEEDSLFVRVTAVNGEDLSLMQEPVAVMVMKDYVTVSDPEVVLDVWQDRWGTEISWVFEDEAGNVLEQMDAYSDLSSNSTERHTHEVTLAAGCNVFVIKDLAGDGINCGVGEGHLQISDAAGEMLLQNDGTYTDSLVWLLRYSPAGNEALAGMEGGMDLKLWPNPAPAASEVSLAFNLDEPACLQVSVLAADGRLALDLDSRAYPVGQNIVALPLDGFAPGLYLVLLQGDSHAGVARLVVR